MFYPVQKCLVEFCWGNGGYYFSTRYSVVALIFHEKVVAAGWGGVTPNSNHVTLALQHVNSLPIYRFEDQADARMWNCICCYVCVMDILSMQEIMMDYFRSHNSPGGNWGDDRVGIVLGLGDWLKELPNQKLVWEMVPQRRPNSI